MRVALAVLGAVAALAVGWVAALSGGGTPAPLPTENGGISAGRIRDHVYFLAADELQGRGATTAGYLAAVEYVEAELRAAGVEPLFAAAGEGVDGEASLASQNAYRQLFEMRTWDIDRSGSMLVRTAGSATRLTLLEDLTVAQGALDDAWRGAHKVVYVGAGVHEPELDWDDYAGLDLKDKCVALLFEIPDALLGAMPPGVRERNPVGNDGLRRRVLHAAERGASCLIVVPPPQLPEFWQQFIVDPGQLSKAEPSDLAVRPNGGAELLVLAASRRARDLLFAGQQHEPSVDGRTRSFELRDVAIELDLTMRIASTAADFNVGGLVAGTDPTLTNEVIVLTAHLDGQGLRPDGAVLNSANDNASSAAALMEVARALAARPARRPVVVLFPGAEETGLTGSRYFVNASPLELERYALNVNMEMIGKRARRGRQYEFRVTGRHSDEIETIVRATETNYGDAVLRYERRFDTPEYRYRRSDHVNFFLRGIPTIYFYGGGADYHRPTDDADRIEMGKVVTMAEILVQLIRVTDQTEALPRSDGRP